MFNLLWFIFASRFESRCGIFWFWDGRKYRRIDALKTLGELYSLDDFDWDETPAGLEASSSIVQLDALTKIAGVVRKVFGVPEFDNGGLTNLGCTDVLTAFRVYLRDVKKNGNLWPISSVSPVSEPALLDVPPPLPSSGLDSTSISTESSPDQPGLPAGQIQAAIPI